MAEKLKVESRNQKGGVVETGGKKFYLALALLTSWLFNPGVVVGAEPSETRETTGAMLGFGRSVYIRNCAICHGPAGNGRGMAAHMFITQPRDFTRGIFKFRSTPSGSLPTDDDLIRTISRGLRGTPMVSQGYLRRREIEAAVAYLKTLSPRFSEQPPSAPLQVPEKPAGSSEVIDKGRRLYQEAGCNDCHGSTGLGDGQSGRDLKDEWGFPSKPADLTRPLKRGSTPEDIYQTLITGLDGTPMPSYQDALTEEQLWALSFYVASLNSGKFSRDQYNEEMRGQMVLRMHGPGGMRGPPMRGMPPR